MYVCMYACVYVCVCTYVCMYIRTYVCMYVCMYVHMYVCMNDFESRRCVKLSNRSLMLICVIIVRQAKQESLTNRNDISVYGRRVLLSSYALFSYEFVSCLKDNLKN